MEENVEKLLTPAEVASWPSRVSESFSDRLFSKIEIGDCWRWTGASNKGYGVIGRGSRGSGNIETHRAVWMLLVGEIPDGWQLDHLCRNHSCVNPDHLEPVTQAVNIGRGEGVSVQHSRRSECNHGHLLDGVTITKKSGAIRYCKTCARNNVNRRRKNGIRKPADTR